jgi:LysR family transcriptional regulator, transcriptional activator for dmlA
VNKPKTLSRALTRSASGLRPTQASGTSLDLAFFNAVANGRTLAEAARGLGLTPAAVSKRLAALERRLGVQLVMRSSRAVGLTDEGQRLADGATVLLTQMDALEQSVTGKQAIAHGLLRINSSFGFGRKFLAPIISKFARVCPEVQVRLELTDRLMQPGEHSFDLAIWLDEPADSRLVAKAIAPNIRYACASPAYLKRHGIPKAPADLAQHNCLVIRQYEPGFSLWRFSPKTKRTAGASASRNESIKVRGNLSSNDGEVVKRWAVEGHGIMVRSEWDIHDEVRTGKLKLLLTDWVQPDDSVFALYPPELRESLKVQKFIEFLAQELGSPPPWRC